MDNRRTRPWTRTSKLSRLAATCAVALAAVNAATSPALATQWNGEPFNNNPPWSAAAAYGAQVTLFGDQGHFTSGLYAIETSTDVDYFVLGCNQVDPALPPRFVDWVAITFNHAAGDLDMYVATISGSDYIDYSSGITNTERVDVLDDFGTVVLEVHGYNGAKGSYQMEYHCRD